MVPAPMKPTPVRIPSGSRIRSITPNEAAVLPPSGSRMLASSQPHGRVPRGGARRPPRRGESGAGEGRYLASLDREARDPGLSCRHKGCSTLDGRESEQPLQPPVLAVEVVEEEHLAILL